MQRRLAVLCEGEREALPFYSSSLRPSSSGSRWSSSETHDGMFRALSEMREESNVSTILLIVLILLLLGAVPAWPHSRSWGYAPSGMLGLLVVILLVLALTGRI